MKTYPIERKVNIVSRVISLSSSTERRSNVVANLSRLGGIDWSFFDALLPDAEIGLASCARAQVRTFGRPLTPGELGCYKSHVAMLTWFCESDAAPWLLALEDDVLVDVHFDFAALVDTLDKAEIGYLRLYARQLKPYSTVGRIGERQLVRFRSDPYGTQAYLITKRSARRFLASISAINMPIDDEMGRFWNNGLEIFSLFPFPVMELATPSTIAPQRVFSERKRVNNSVSRIWFRASEKTRKIFCNIGASRRRVELPSAEVNVISLSQAPRIE